REPPAADLGDPARRRAPQAVARSAPPPVLARLGDLVPVRRRASCRRRLPGTGEGSAAGQDHEEIRRRGLSPLVAARTPAASAESARARLFAWSYPPVPPVPPAARRERSPLRSRARRCWPGAPTPPAAGATPGSWSRRGRPSLTTPRTSALRSRTWPARPWT